MPKCTICNRNLDESCFSKSQLRNNRNRKCKECIENVANTNTTNQPPPQPPQQKTVWGKPTNELTNKPPIQSQPQQTKEWGKPKQQQQQPPQQKTVWGKPINEITNKPPPQQQQNKENTSEITNKLDNIHITNQPPPQQKGWGKPHQPTTETPHIPNPPIIPSSEIKLHLEIYSSTNDPLRPGYLTLGEKFRVEVNFLPVYYDIFRLILQN